MKQATVNWSHDEITITDSNNETKLIDGDDELKESIASLKESGHKINDPDGLLELFDTFNFSSLS